VGGGSGILIELSGYADGEFGDVYIKQWRKVDVSKVGD
jgi:hypothetical protein